MDSVQMYLLPCEDGEKKLWFVRGGENNTVLAGQCRAQGYLMENKVEAKPELLHADNRQALVELIYTADTIRDNILENKMAAAVCRDSVLRDMLSLLKKKKILIL